MKRITKPTLAFSLTLALAFTITPAVAQASPLSCVGSAGGAVTVQQDIQEERDEATRQAKAVADKKRELADRRHKDLSNVAKDMLTDAAKTRKTAESSYARNKTTATYSRMVWARAKHGESKDISNGLKVVAGHQLKVERVTIARSFEVTTWAFNTRAFARTQNVPEICRDNLIRDGFETSNTFAPLIDAIAPRSAEEFENLLTTYGKRVGELYSAEARTLVEYEKAIRAHKTSPTGPNRLKMDQAKFARDEAVAQRKRLIPALKREFIGSAKSLHGSQVQLVTSVVADARQSSTTNTEVFVECVCSRQKCD